MESLPCSECRGLCCGPVNITKQELKAIKNKIRLMNPKYRLELENQHRYYGTCIFYDLDKNRCGIYSARPSICRAFGHYSNLVCFKKPEISMLKAWTPVESSVGLLSIDFTWKDFNGARHDT